MCVTENITFEPLCSSNWQDFETLFGSKGAYGGCWCMWWRLTKREFESNQGEDNRLAMKSIISSGSTPGILAYFNGEPCGWCSIAPREDFASLNRSRVLKKIDEEKVWSITCFFIKREFRGQNMGLKLIKAAIEYVKSQNGNMIEAYPTLLKSDKAPPVSSFMGIPKIFDRAGFNTVLKASESKLIMRFDCNS